MHSSNRHPPARMAISPLPRKTALEKVPPSQSAAKPRLKCSLTSQDSKAEKSRLVAMPQSTRPAQSTQKLLKCLVTQPAA